MSTAPILVHYNPDLPIRLAGDASSYGIGAVLSHVLADGTEHPIAFASRSLQAAERNYAQIEKEALALIFGIQKFHKYIYGRTFTLLTDHRPLTTILGPKTGVPPLAAARLQRWALLLSAYNYTIEFRPTAAHANADGLSRLPLTPMHPVQILSETSVFNVAQIQMLPLSFPQLEQATRTDPVLGQVYQFIQQGWPENVPDSLKPFWHRRLELTTEGGCVLWGIRVVVPQKFRNDTLKMLHEVHAGIVRMKELARSYVWWPGLDQDIEAVAKACVDCQAVKSAPAKAPLHPWIWPDKPWLRIHVDFAGPFQGRMFFLIVDAHSKWPEVREVGATTTAKTIEVLRQLFCAYGLPEQLVSDNGPQFTSDEFAIFVKQNGIKHILTAPYHPASNGAVERLVQSFKQAMKATVGNGLTLQQRLTAFLMSYRSTPHATTKETPSKLFLGREIRTRFDLLRPDRGPQVRAQQASQKKNHDLHSRCRTLDVGTSVMVRDLRDHSLWKPGVVVERPAPLSYLVRMQSGQIFRQHIDHLKELQNNPTTVEVATPPVTSIPDETHQEDPAEPGLSARVPLPHHSLGLPALPSASPMSAATTVSPGETVPLTSTPRVAQEPRYPTRQRKPVERLTY